MTPSNRQDVKEDLPERWRRVWLGDAGEIVSGMTLGRKVGKEPMRAVSYLRVANVKDGRLDLREVHESETTKDEIEKLRLRRGDLLLTEGGDPDKLGRGTSWNEELSECIHQNHIFRVRLDTGSLIPEFASLQIASPQGKAYFLSHAKRTTGIATIKRARIWKDHVAEYLVRPGEILVARSNTPELVGRAAVFSGEPSGAVATDLTIRIRPKAVLVPGFLAAHLSCLYLTGYWKNRAGGASGSMKKITREQLQAEQIPVPPPEDQKQIESVIHERLRESRRVYEAAEVEIAAIDALPAALLRRAFSDTL